MIHINKQKKKRESKHTSHSAGYHISKQTKLQGLERSDSLCSDVTLHNTNWTATAETAGEATTSRWSQRVGLSHPYTLEPPKLRETPSQRCCKTLCDSQSAPKKLAGCSAPSSLQRRRRRREGRKLPQSSLKFVSSKEVPGAWQRMRNPVEGLPLKRPLLCRCLPLPRTLWAITSPVPGHDTLRHEP